jgi:hypothetical protein
LQTGVVVSGCPFAGGDPLPPWGIHAGALWSWYRAACHRVFMVEVSLIGFSPGAWPGGTQGWSRWRWWRPYPWSAVEILHCKWKFIVVSEPTPGRRLRDREAISGVHHNLLGDRIKATAGVMEGGCKVLRRRRTAVLGSTEDHRWREARR